MGNQVEARILVAENKKEKLEQIIEKLKELGLKVNREGGGKLPTFSGYKLPTFSGYYAVLIL